jgi:hypothetical protein
MCFLQGNEHNKDAWCACGIYGTVRIPRPLTDDIKLCAAVEGDVWDDPAAHYDAQAPSSCEALMCCKYHNSI